MAGGRDSRLATRDVSAEGRGRESEEEGRAWPWPGRRLAGTNLLADLAALLGEPAVGVCGQLRERRLFGLLETEGEHENGADEHDAHWDRVHVLRVLQQQANVIHGGSRG